METNAQDSIRNSIKIGGYLETYYLYDFGNPQNHERPSFVYSFNRHNEVNLNLGLIKATYETDKVRVNLGLMSGTYTNANLINEPGVLKNIFESNAGIKISKNKNLWVDAGIFASHIGFESAIGMDCWNLTRSILADNSPYYESGLKLSYTSASGKWFLSALYLNGWQTIQRVAGNNTPSFGHQITYKPNSKLTLNSSSFVGSLVPDSIRQMRYFHNLYAQMALSDKFAMIVGFDIGAQQKSKFSHAHSIWHTPVLIGQYTFSQKLKVAMRLEYYNDPKQVVVFTGTTNGFQTLGYSMNLDYMIEKNILWRIEARGFNASDKIFMENEKPSSTNYFISTSLAARLN